jgi:hypothetical protein
VQWQPCRSLGTHALSSCPRPTPLQACELFGLELQELLQPASRRQLLAALLVDLRDCHWAKAAGCSPKPAFLTPLDAETALAGRVRVQQGGYSITRALAAAEKRLLLLPEDRWGRLQLLVTRPGDAAGGAAGACGGACNGA